VADEKGDAAIIGRNVGALLPGSDPELKHELIILSAHYDHLGTRDGEIYPGADDNASGVAMMLEVSRRLAVLPERPRRSIAFVGFDLEERMLWGSRWFVAHAPWELEQIKFFMTADMIGRSLGDLPLPAVFVLGSEHAPALKDMLDRVEGNNELEVCRLGIDLVGTRSDYGPFRDRKIPFLFFSTGEHPDYHTPRDIPERVDYEKVANVSELALDICVDTGNADEAPVWTDDVDGDLDEPQTLNRIATLLLEAEKERPLNDIQRMLVTHAKNKTQQILDRGSIEQKERTWLIRVSQVMLFSVF
jgi:Zn-dependent M28 family amino/carboxypeptidase